MSACTFGSQEQWSENHQVASQLCAMALGAFQEPIANEIQRFHTCSKTFLYPFYFKWTLICMVLALIWLFCFVYMVIAVLMYIRLIVSPRISSIPLDFVFAKCRYLRAPC